MNGWIGGGIDGWVYIRMDGEREGIDGWMG